LHGVDTAKMFTSKGAKVGLVAHSEDKLDAFAVEVFASKWMKNVGKTQTNG
jgi:hypothetical protein